MKQGDRKGADVRYNYLRPAIAVAGIIVNVLLTWLTCHFRLPLYLDTIGTVLASLTGGLFTGMLTGVASALFSVFFNQYSVYFVLVSVGIAFTAAMFRRAGKLKKLRHIVLLITLCALLGGCLGMLIQWALIGGPQFEEVSTVARMLSGMTGMSYFTATLILSTVLNLVDKGITVSLALIIFRFIPEKVKQGLWDSSWKQKPLSREALSKTGTGENAPGVSLRSRMTVMLIMSTMMVAVVMTMICIAVYNKSVIAEYTENAKNAAAFAAEVIDPDKVEEYVIKGERAKGYMETKRLLERIRNNSDGVLYLYVLRVERDGCRFIFDLDTEDDKGYEPGEKVDFEEAFLPYLDELLEGKDIEPIESNDVWGWVLSAYHPVRNKEGRTVCYAAADVSMSYVSGYVRDLILRMLIIFSGFFIVIVGYGMWLSGYYLIYPIKSMTDAAGSLIRGSAEQKELDENVKQLKALDIHTGDEVEQLYRAICTMASDTAERMREMRYYAEATSRMQNGMIITMADMVENRDSDTGAHVQKTAAYVRIILEGLKRKGYYAEKLTPKYMSDVEMSAPLHDVGKISIPDAILNKPGKLTEAEFEIMKTHTTEGKKIMERAINTTKGQNYLKEARNMAAYHHERWDGKGYPEGLREEVIPLSARVMAVADVFDALSSPRVYKPAFPLEKALEIISEGSGKQFDPKCVEVFMESLDEVKAVLKKYHEE